MPLEAPSSRLRGDFFSLPPDIQLICVNEMLAQGGGSADETQRLKDFAEHLTLNMAKCPKCGHRYPKK